VPANQECAQSHEGERKQQYHFQHHRSNLVLQCRAVIRAPDVPPAFHGTATAPEG
jgi:hypothetical protein